MKKGFSIVMAVLVLLTGLHLSVASHYCHGKLAAVKISITGEKATCGMEDEAESSAPAGKFFKTHCCVNELATLAVDSSYSPSTSLSIDFTHKIVPVFATPVLEVVNELVLVQYSYPILSPPGISRSNSVDLTAICVFRI
ncbi:MAG: hypothetical protein WCP85_22610 [Mariniphaga sp.]